MIDSKQLNHDLAIAAASISAHKNFESEVDDGTPDEMRASFADYLKDEYDFFFNYYTAKR